ncbi:MAG: hypothetical protein V4505_25725 [Pseudomonadota bacterium]
MARAVGQSRLNALRWAAGILVRNRHADDRRQRMHRKEQVERAGRSRL